MKKMVAFRCHLLPAAEHYSTDFPIVWPEKMRRFVVETPELFRSFVSAAASFSILCLSDDEEFSFLRNFVGCQCFTIGPNGRLSPRQHLKRWPQGEFPCLDLAFVQRPCVAHLSPGAPDETCRHFGQSVTLLADAVATTRQPDVEIRERGSSGKEMATLVASGSARQWRACRQSQTSGEKPVLLVIHWIEEEGVVFEDKCSSQ
jgi:hypothetical protein